MHYINKVLNLLMVSVTFCVSMFAMDNAEENKSTPPKSALATLARNTVVGAALGSLEPITGTPCFYFSNAMQPTAGQVAKSWSQRLRNLSLSPRVWYSSFGTMVAGMAPITAVQNGCAEGLNQAVMAVNHQPLTDGQRLATATAAGGLGALVSCPQELLAQRQQYANENRNVLLSTRQAFNEVYATNGLRGLYRGFWPVAFRDAGFVAGFKALPPLVERVYKPYLDNEQARKLAATLTAGVAAAVMTHPAARLRKCMQDDLLREFPSTWQTLCALVKNQGLKSLRDGLEFRGLRVVLAVLGMSYADRALQKALAEKGK